jgi:hypothetical protein
VRLHEDLAAVDVAAQAVAARATRRAHRKEQTAPGELAQLGGRGGRTRDLRRTIRDDPEGAAAMLRVDADLAGKREQHDLELAAGRHLGQRCRARQGAGLQLRPDLDPYIVTAPYGERALQGQRRSR